MKASLQLSMSQHLTLTPQLQQAIRLLQLSTLDLNQEIQSTLESNPMLEVLDTNHDITVAKKSNVSVAEKPINSDSHFHDHYSSSSYKKSSNEAFNYEHFYSTTTTLKDHLLWQLEMATMTDTDYAIAIAIIDAINGDGFLSASLGDICLILNAESIGVNQAEIEAVRSRILRFDPIGSGAIDLQESLMVQLEQHTPESDTKKLAQKIIAEDLELIAQHNYRHILKKHQVDDRNLNNALALIRTLTPHPGEQIATTATEYVIPDVTVNKATLGWEVSLNGDALPKLNINRTYASMVKRANNSEENTFLKTNLQEARWFLKSLQSRQETLLKVARCIIDFQQDFLENGAESMKPLVLNDIATRLNLHESTISRVTTRKYIHTPRGIFELKYFFSSHVTTKSGGECSSTAVRAVIKKIIANEPPDKPLSDNKISQLLKNKGINVARRTIAKYRENMQVPPSNERKLLNPIKK